MSDAETRWIEDCENACPCCGGSGHKDDATPYIEELETARDEALNQLDSALHSVSVLEKRIENLQAGNARLQSLVLRAADIIESGPFFPKQEADEIRKALQETGK